MVSQRNLIFLAAAALAVGLGGFAFSKTKQGGTLIQNVFGAKDIEAAEIINPNAEEITGLKSLLSQAQSFFRSSFPKPRTPPGSLTTGSGKTFCRGPNCLGSLQARGTVIGLDPFTGGLAQVGFTPRFNFGKIDENKFNAVLFNAARFKEGNILKSEFATFISGIKEQIGLLENTNNVTL